MHFEFGFRRWLCVCAMLCMVATVTHCSDGNPPGPGLSGLTGAANLDAALPEERAQITNVFTSLRVDEIGPAVTAIRVLVDTHEGYVQDASADARSAVWQLRIPADELASFRDALADVGEIASDRESTLDVTGQQADLGARVRNARIEEERLLRLLEEQTGALADVLTVERELARVRELVERMTAQERLLERDVRYAHVHVDIATREIVLSEEPGQSIITAAMAGLDVAWTVLVGTAVTLVAVGPTLLLLSGFVVALLWLARGLVRLRRRRAVV